MFLLIGGGGNKNTAIYAIANAFVNVEVEVLKRIEEVKAAKTSNDLITADNYKEDASNKLKLHL